MGKIHSVKNQKSIITKSAEYVKPLLSKELPEWAVYHNINHTLETVGYSEKMARYYKLSPDEAEVLTIAAWFHDTGYILGPHDHEQRSVNIAAEFLQGHLYETKKIFQVSEIIMATKLPSAPDNLLEEIIHDADLVSLGKPDYLETNELLRQEFQIREKTKINETDWLKRSELFLLSHTFHTEYAAKRFNEQLNQNLKLLRRKLAALSSYVK